MVWPEEENYNSSDDFEIMNYNDGHFKIKERFVPGTLFLSEITGVVHVVIGSNPVMVLNERGNVGIPTNRWLILYNHEFIISF